MVSQYNIKPFGLNVIPDVKTAEQGTRQVQHTIENALGALWEPVLDYLKTNENVFSGNVSSEIERINMQTLQLGTIVNGSKEIRNIDMQF